MLFSMALAKKMYEVCLFLVILVGMNDEFGLSFVN
jgi:hypothetical protein